MTRIKAGGDRFVVHCIYANVQRRLRGERTAMFADVFFAIGFAVLAGIYVIFRVEERGVRVRVGARRGG